MGGKKNAFLLFGFVAVVLIAAFYFFKDTRLIVDEKDNYPQIINFINFKFQLLEISAVPGYHALMAACAKVFGINSIAGVRGISLFFSFLSVLVFYLVANKISPSTSVTKTLQYFFLPVLFIFFFLL